MGQGKHLTFGMQTTSRAVRSTFRRRLLTDKRPHYECVHFRPLKTVDRFGGLTDNGLVLIEACIENDGNARESLKLFNQIVVQRVFLMREGLQSARVVHVVNSHQFLSPLWPDFVDMQHEG